MATTILKTDGLSKSYKGFKAVDSLSIDVQPKMIYGLLGPNGSGKTTTLGMLLGRNASERWALFHGSKTVKSMKTGSELEPYLETPISTLT